MKTILGVLVLVVSMLVACDYSDEGNNTVLMSLNEADADATAPVCPVCNCDPDVQVQPDVVEPTTLEVVPMSTSLVFLSIPTADGTWPWLLGLRGTYEEVSQFDVARFWTAPGTGLNTLEVPYIVDGFEPQDFPYGNYERFFVVPEPPYQFANFYNNSTGTAVLLVNPTAGTPTCGLGVKYFCSVAATPSCYFGIAKP